VNSTEQYLVDEELWHYSQGWISRREFLRRATVLGAGAAAAATLGAITPAAVGAAPGAQVSPFHVPVGDPSVAADWVWYRSNDGVELKAYLAWPTDAAMTASLPGVAVCQENQGTNAYILDVTRRFAKAGYMAIAPDLVSRFGIPTDEFTEPTELTGAMRRLSDEQTPLDVSAALDYLRSHPAVDESKLAAIGFCMGGDVIWRLATMYPDLKAAAPFYGSNPSLDQVPNIRAAMLGVYGDLDTRTNVGIEALKDALQAAGITHRITIYPNSQHAFHADHRTQYNAETATQAWTDTLNWFATYLGLQPPTM